MIFFVVLCYTLFAFWLSHVACGILIPRPGIEATTLALDAWCPNQQLLGKSCTALLYFDTHYLVHLS